MLKNVTSLGSNCFIVSVEMYSILANLLIIARIVSLPSFVAAFADFNAVLVE